MYRKIFLLLVVLLASSWEINAMQVSKELKSEWQFKQARLTNWYPATVPGVVHTDLLANGIIEDPFYRLNERGMQWIDKEDWIYETNFDLPEDIYSDNNIQILFKGLDTYADVYLNNVKIISANNMFRQWTADIKKIVKKTGNNLKVYLHSPIKTDIPKWDALPIYYKAANDQSENGGIFDKKLSVVARKAGYHYGWDWGPRLVTSGIWRPVFINSWTDARIENIQVIQDHVTAKQAIIKTVVEVVADSDFENATVSITDKDATQKWGETVANLKKGLNKIEIKFTIKNPKLWWSNGLGEAHLYNFKTSLVLNNKVVDCDTTKIGIRSIRFVNKSDNYGKSFYFELNGIPVFAKGANYIPCDIFLPRVTRAIYKKTVLDAVDANMNMLRVWGGGIYEDDYFYDLCDEYGILVFQDFMFACSIYPAEGELLENIRLEAIDNVKRLRNHASIAIWCGNNECQDAWFGWGWKKEYEKIDQKFADVIWKQFQDQYYDVLPAVVAEYGSDISYTPSSPFAGYGVAGNDHEGDRHYWEVWHGQKPIAEYNKERSRFFSEYGFQSFPEFESVKQYAPKESDWSISSEVMMSHQRGGEHANKLIETYLLNEYFAPEDFQSFLYMNHILQGDAIRTAIEAHRRDMGYCMGTLFWQHNDCWPVASWSSRDYYGRWKAQHYFTREAYRDILVSPIAKDDSLSVYIVSDKLKNTSGILTLNIINLEGGAHVYTQKMKVNIKANTSSIVFTQDLKTLLKGAEKRNVVVNAVLSTDQKVYANNYFLLMQKEISYPEAIIQTTIKSIKEGFEVALTSRNFARAVYMSIDGIDNFFDNNYFDIIPGDTIITKVSTNLSGEAFRSQLKIKSLADMKKP
jgi:beta-mannosidase